MTTTKLKHPEAITECCCPFPAHNPFHLLYSNTRPKDLRAALCPCPTPGHLNLPPCRPPLAPHALPPTLTCKHTCTQAALDSTQRPCETTQGALLQAPDRLPAPSCLRVCTSWLPSYQSDSSPGPSSLECYLPREAAMAPPKLFSKSLSSLYCFISSSQKQCFLSQNGGCYT